MVGHARAHDDTLGGRRLSGHSTAARARGGRVRTRDAPSWKPKKAIPRHLRLVLIGELFLIERDLPDWQCITDERLQAQALALIRETRQARSKPLVEALAAWAKAQRALKGSKLGEAVTYLNNRWDGLLVFLDDPGARRHPRDYGRARGGRSD
ncbi:MAG: hypothetical protein JWN04_406 [Myxococcaceae bacterium]|nr:hypothetical protein [Myxococcaceae bacterium]